MGDLVADRGGDADVGDAERFGGAERGAGEACEENRISYQGTRMDLLRVPISVPVASRWSTRLARQGPWTGQTEPEISAAPRNEIMSGIARRPSGPTTRSTCCRRCSGSCSVHARSWSSVYRAMRSGGRTTGARGSRTRRRRGVGHDNRCAVFSGAEPAGEKGGDQAGEGNEEARGAVDTEQAEGRRERSSGERSRATASRSHRGDRHAQPRRDPRGREHGDPCDAVARAATRRGEREPGEEGGERGSDN